MNILSGSFACHADDDIALPSVEALLAATLALMTGYAEHAGAPPQADANDAGGIRQDVRHTLAAKVTTQLFHLSGHPLLSPAFRSAIWQLRGHWQAVERRAAAPAPADPCGTMPWPTAPVTRH